jgi:hypothetical protein
MPKLLKPKQAADEIGRSVRYIYYLEERGELEMVRDGRAASVVAESLDAYVERLRKRAEQAAKAKQAAKAAAHAQAGANERDEIAADAAQ